MEKILRAFGLEPSKYNVEPIHAGHINHTYKLTGPTQLILQRINTDVFKKPETIAKNISLASDYLNRHHRDYTFLTPVFTTSGRRLERDEEGYAWRMFPYLENTFTIDQIESKEQAIKIARGFATLVRNLDGCDVSKFGYTLPDFHNLHARFDQFKKACADGNPARIQQAKATIRLAEGFSSLVGRYDQLIQSDRLRLRVMHNDTKVNNILLDKTTGDVVCVIDLDTLMPGYFIYDLGDMIRTFVSLAAEDEADLSKVSVRLEIKQAIEDTYLDVLGGALTPDEINAKDFAGPMMTYIMALRFLTDFLNNDQYYHTAYPNHNLVRAQNQFRLLELLFA